MVHTIQIRIFKSFLKRIYYNPQSLQQGGCLICYYLSPPCMRKPTITRLDASLFWQGSRGISGQSHMLYVLNSLTTAYWLERFATCRFSIAGPRAWWNPIGVIFVPLRTDNRKAKNPRFSLAFVHFCHAIGHHRSHRTVGWWFGTWLLFSIIEGSLEVKLPTIWRDEKQSRAEAQRRGRLEERRSEEKE
jgi:hypothetical protein